MFVAARSGLSGENCKNIKEKIKSCYCSCATLEDKALKNGGRINTFIYQ